MVGREALPGDTVEGLASIEDGIEDWRATGAILVVPYYLALKAEALYLMHRTSEALEAIAEAEVLVERSEDRHWCAELHRLRGVFLTDIGSDETKIEASFCAAIGVAREQKSISLERRAEESLRRISSAKGSGSGGHQFRLPLCNAPSYPLGLEIFSASAARCRHPQTPRSSNGEGGLRSLAILPDGVIEGEIADVHEVRYLNTDA